VDDVGVFPGLVGVSVCSRRTRGGRGHTWGKAP
jgi:hypothetical protein